MKTLYFFILSPIYLLWIFFGATHEDCFGYQPQTKNRTNLLAHYPGIDTAADYAGSVSLELHSTSVLLEKEILEQTQSGEPIVVDVVGIGGGPQNAIAFSILKQSHPNLSTLVFEGSHRAGTFDKLRGTFQLNSPENYRYESHLLKNIFVGSPVQMTDFFGILPREQHVFPRDESAADTTLLAYYFADAGLVFDQEVVNVLPQESAVGKYKIRTKRGLEVFANHIVVATGLGTPKIHLTDPESQVLVQKEFNLGTGIETIDSFLSRISENITLSGSDAALAAAVGLLPKKTLVIGAGDGGKIVIEALRGAAQENKIIYWAGQRTFNQKEFDAHFLNSILKDRYSPIGALLGNWVLPISKHVSKIRKTPDGQFLVTLEPASLSEFKAFNEQINLGRPPKRPEEEPSELIVGKIIFATGYDLAPPKIFGEFLSSIEEVIPQKGDFSDFVSQDSRKGFKQEFDQVGSRIMGHQIWRIGPHSVPEIGNTAEYGGYFDLSAYGPLSAEMGRIIGTEAQRSALTPPFEFGTVSLKDGPLKFKVEKYLTKKHPSQGELMEIKLSLARILKNFKFSGPETFISIDKFCRPEHCEVEFNGFDEKSARVILEQVKSVRLLSETEFSVRFSIRSDGSISLETLRVIPRS